MDQQTASAAVDQTEQLGEGGVYDNTEHGFGAAYIASYIRRFCGGAPLVCVAKDARIWICPWQDSRDVFPEYDWELTDHPVDALAMAQTVELHLKGFAKTSYALGHVRYHARADTRCGAPLLHFWP